MSTSDAIGGAAPFYNPTSMVYQGSKLKTWTDSAAESGFTYTYDNDGRLTGAVAARVTKSAVPNSLPQTYTDTSSFISTGVDSLWSLTSVTQTIGTSTTTSAYVPLLGDQSASISPISTALTYQNGNETSQTTSTGVWNYTCRRGGADCVE